MDVRTEVLTMCGFRLASDAAAAASEKQSFRLRDELDRYQNLPKHLVQLKQTTAVQDLSIGLLVSKNGKSFLLDVLSPN